MYAIKIIQWKQATFFGGGGIKSTKMCFEVSSHFRYLVVCTIQTKITLLIRDDTFSCSIPMPIRYVLVVGFFLDFYLDHLIISTSVCNLTAHCLDMVNTTHIWLIFCTQHHPFFFFFVALH